MRSRNTLNIQGKIGTESSVRVSGRDELGGVEITKVDCISLKCNFMCTVCARHSSHMSMIFGRIMDQFQEECLVQEKQPWFLSFQPFYFSLIDFYAKILYAPSPLRSLRNFDTIWQGFIIVTCLNNNSSFLLWQQFFTYLVGVSTFCLPSYLSLKDVLKNVLCGEYIRQLLRYFEVVRQDRETGSVVACKNHNILLLPTLFIPRCPPIQPYVLDNLKKRSRHFHE